MPISRKPSQELLQRLIVQEIGRQIQTELLDRLDNTIVVHSQNQKPPKKKQKEAAKPPKKKKK